MNERVAGLSAVLQTTGLGHLVNRARRRGADLQGQVALVTGASRGLGFLLARDFARQGCKIVICARDEVELERARQDLEREGAEVLAVHCDVTNQAEVEAMARAATERFGRVDILVNNAGIIQVGPIDNMTLRDFEDAMATEFWGLLYATFAILPGMRERGTGRIVNITSVGGKVSVPHLLPYASAKFAAVGFSEGLRSELSRAGVTVTTIVPGLMRTGSPLNALFKGRHDQEYAWFTLGDSVAGVSMDAERAAAHIVQATRRGEAERILSLPAQVLAAIHGLFPGLTADLLGVVNALILPPPGEGESAMKNVRGMELQDRVQSPLFHVLLTWTLSAARRFNQYGGRPVAYDDARQAPRGTRGRRR